MRKFLILSLALFLSTTAGCRSLPENEYVFPPKPERKEISAPKTEKDYALVIAYYESLVEEWEAWAEAVEGQKN